MKEKAEFWILFLLHDKKLKINCPFTDEACPSNLITTNFRRIQFTEFILRSNSMSILHKELPYYFVHVTVIEEADRNSDQENLVSSGKLFC